MSVWQAARAADATLTRMVTGAILSPYETQRLVVNGKTGTSSSATPEMSKCVPIDPGGEMATQLWIWLCFTFIDIFSNSGFVVDINFKFIDIGA